MLCRGDSLGVFQVESRAQMNMLPRLKPRVLLRPGHRGRDRPAGADPGRHGPSLSEAPQRQGAGDLPLPRPGARPARRTGEDPRPDARRADLPGAGDEDRARCRASSARRRRTSCARRWRPSARRGISSRSRRRWSGGWSSEATTPHFAQRCFDQIKGFGEYGFPESHAASFAHLVYVSSWLRWKYPAAFACALLNSQPMGFYAPAQIVRDAREHGVEVREVDVNRSDWDCTLETRPPPRPAPGRWVAARSGGPASVGAALSDCRGAAHARRRAGACDPAARGGGCVPLDGPRPARGAVGFARAETGARSAAVRLCRGARRRVGRPAGAAPRHAALRACRERLPDDPPQPEGAPDALPARALCGAEIRHRRPAQDYPRRQATVDRAGWC